MTVSPFHAIAVVINDQVRLRVYKGPRLELEMPLRSRQALVLATQLLNHALMVDATSPDGGVLEAPDEKDIAVGKCAHGC